MTAAAEVVSTTAAAPASAPEAVPGPSADSGPAAKPSTPAQRFARASAMLSGAKPAAAPALGGVAETPAADPAPATDAPAEAAAEVPAAEAAPAQRAGESDDKYVARLAKALSDLTQKDVTLLQRDGELKSERAAREAKEAEIKALSAKLDAISKDPIAALKAAGTSYDELTRLVLEGKIKAPTAEDDLRAKVDEKTKSLEDKYAELQAKLEAKEKAEAEATAKTQAEAQRTKDLDTVKTLLPAKDFPLITALGAHDAVLERCYAEQSQDVAGQAAAWEKHVLSQLEQLITPQTLAALETRSPKIRETVKALKGAADQSRKPVVSSDGPRVLAADTVSAPSTPIERPATEAERKKRALALLFKQGG